LLTSPDVQSSSAQQQNLVPFTQLAKDLLSGSLPDYSFITPTAAMTLMIAPSASPTTAQNNIDPLIRTYPSKKPGADHCVR